jgi:uncharacterized cupredoxin-like copper-binding protein
MLKRLMFALVPAVAFALAACGGDGTGGPAPTSPTGGATEGGVRTVEITALDTLRFEPDRITVEVGETVRFVVTNGGKTVHDFFVGTEEEQEAHEEEMAEAGGMDHGSAEGLVLDPGETGELTVTFDEPGELSFACHQPGHYAAGMVGTITVV